MAASEMEAPMTARLSLVACSHCPADYACVRQKTRRSPFCRSTFCEHKRCGSSSIPMPENRSTQPRRQRHRAGQCREGSDGMGTLPARNGWCRNRILIIAVRTGNDRAVRPTIKGGRIDQRPGSRADAPTPAFESADSAGSRRHERSQYGSAEPRTARQQRGWPVGRHVCGLSRRAFKPVGRTSGLALHRQRLSACAPGLGRGEVSQDDCGGGKAATAAKSRKRLLPFSRTMRSVAAAQALFVYIPHDPCPRSTTVLSNAPSAGPTTLPSSFNATTTSKAAPIPNCGTCPNRWPVDRGTRFRPRIAAGHPGRQPSALGRGLPGNHRVRLRGRAPRHGPA